MGSYHETCTVDGKACDMNVTSHVDEDGYKEFSCSRCHRISGDNA